MTRQHKLTLGLIAVVLAIQFVVPSIQYFSDGPNRFGWQMYSRENPRPDITAVNVAEERSSVDLNEFVIVLRGELRVTEQVLDELCTLVDGTRYFELEYPFSVESRVHECIS
jgi:hypothetical protein